MALDDVHSLLIESLQKHNTPAMVCMCNPTGKGSQNSLKNLRLWTYQIVQ